MKMLYIYGDDDYHFITFEQSNLTVENIVQALENGHDERFYVCDCDNEDCDNGDECDNQQYFDAKIFTFDKVDPKFIDWIKDHTDYDETKHHDFIVIEE